ncbi:hypothetical protein AOQ84DRAFT_106598 [Glonium stellatum]|uniref:Uncharacterized protein n=1 Tax=Glonium stellatum TaxID=574774 RepID=A0A8E2JPK3_9PEZI|nr:hypothetical protein AOQ84DRAFT_106598 [Glonium stellatum]
MNLLRGLHRRNFCWSAYQAFLFVNSSALCGRLKKRCSLLLFYYWRWAVTEATLQSGSSSPLDRVASLEPVVNHFYRISARLRHST